MFCTKCGAELFDGATFCTNCGAEVKKPAAAETPVEPVVEEAPVQAEPVVEETPVQTTVLDGVPIQAAPVYQQPTPQASSTYYSSPIVAQPVSRKNGIASMVLGIVGIVTGCCIYIGIVPLILGIIGSVMSKKAAQDGYTTDPAKAGKITSIISIVFGGIEVFFGLVLAVICIAGLGYAESTGVLPEIMDELERELVLIFGIF